MKSRILVAGMLLSALLITETHARDFERILGQIRNRTNHSFTRIELDVRIDAIKGNPFNGGGEICGKAEHKQIFHPDSQGNVKFEIPRLSVSCRRSVFKPVYSAQVLIRIPEWNIAINREFYADLDRAMPYELSLLTLYRLPPQTARIRLEPGSPTNDWNYLQYRLSVLFPGEADFSALGAAERNSRLFFVTLPADRLSEVNLIRVERSLGAPVMAVRGDPGPNPLLRFFLEVASRGYGGVLYQARASSRLEDGLPDSMIEISIASSRFENR